MARSFRPEPERRLVGANGRAALEVVSEPLGLERPLVSDEHVDLRRSVRVHVEGQDLLQPRAPAHVLIRDLVDGRGLGRDRHGRPDEVGSDGDDLPAHEIDSADLHDGVVRGGAGCLKVDDAEAGGFVRVSWPWSFAEESASRERGEDPVGRRYPI